MRPPPWTADRRRRFVVTSFQATYVATHLAWTGLLLLGFAALVFGPTAHELFTGGEREQIRAATVFLQLHARLWPALVALAAALTLLVLTQSHRVIGPLVRFKAVFEAVTRGELWVPSRLRSGDYPTVEAEALEAMLASLRTRVGEAQAASDRAAALLDDVSRDTARDEQLRAAIADVRQTLAFYQVARPADGPPPAVAARERHPRGFTLIEVVLVAAVIGLLSAVAAPVYVGVLDKARVTRAIGDLRSMQSEIQSQYVVQGCYPSSLDELGYGFLRDPWGHPYTYGVLAASPGGGGGGGRWWWRRRRRWWWRRWRRRLPRLQRPLHRPRSGAQGPQSGAHQL
jgi:prepilin-type N-terminal cleavage/methylation domain-containing protein